MKLRAVFAVVSCAASVLVLLSETLRQQAHYDDAYITYRYARNLVEGNGLVYNVGEYVEGITNLLWALLIAGGIWLGFDPELVAHVLGVTVGVLGILASYAYARALVPEAVAWLAGLAPWVVLSTAAYPYSATSGMETMLFLASVTAALAAHAWGRIGGSTFFLVTATLTRPDGILAATCVLGDHLLRGKGSPWRRLIPPLTYGAAILGLTLFRIWYYGSPVPNTFYAKVGGATLSLLWFWNAMSPMFPLLIPAAIAVSRNRACRAGGMFSLIYFAYLVNVGATWQRFLLPLVPVLASLAVAGTAEGFVRSRPLGVLLCGCILSTLAWSVFSFPVALVVFGVTSVAALRLRPFAKPTWVLPAASALCLAVATWLILSGANLGFADVSRPLATSSHAKKLQTDRRLDSGFRAIWRDYALELRNRADEFRLVGGGAIGALGYYSRLPILDYLGLVDPVISRSNEDLPAGISVPIRIAGHSRSNAAYVLSRKPDLIIMPEKSTAHSLLPAVLALWHHPDLERCYEYEAAWKGYRRRPRCYDEPSLSVEKVGQERK